MHKRVIGVLVLFFVLIVALPMGQILAESLDVSASVNATLPPNGEVPMIETPDDNSTQTLQNVFITGKCIVFDPTLIVVLLRGGQTIGTGPCLPDGTFRILVGLDKGKNIIVPMYMTITGLTSSFGKLVTIIYDQPANITPATGAQSCVDEGLNILLDYDFITYSDTTLSQILYTVKQGCEPYIVTINWGDGTQTTSKVTNNDAQTATHQYDTVLPPSALTITAVDSNGIKAVQSRALLSFKKGLYIPAAPVKVGTMGTAQKVWLGMAALSILILLAHHFSLIANTALGNNTSKHTKVKKRVSRR